MPANLHVRNVDDAVIANLKRRAAENGRSAEAEHRATLDRVYGVGLDADWTRKAAELREAIRRRNGGPLVPGSEILLREDRDSR